MQTTECAACIFGVELSPAVLDDLDTERCDGLFFADFASAHTELPELMATTRATYQRLNAVHRGAELALSKAPNAKAARRRQLRENMQIAAQSAHARFQAGDDTGLAESVDQLQDLASKLDAMRPQPAVLNEGAARRPRRRQRGKNRRKLAGLPADWDVQLLRAAPQTDRPWIAALNLSGARPGVLGESGVCLEAGTDYLLVRSGASKGGPCPDPIVYSLEHPVAAAMHAYVSASGGVLQIKKSYDAAKNRHERITQAAFGRRLPLGVHRHQLHADMKAGGHERTTVARVTGKRATASISVYATAHRGRRSRGQCLRRSNAMTTAPAGPDLPDTQAFDLASDAIHLSATTDVPKPGCPRWADACGPLWFTV